MMAVNDTLQLVAGNGRTTPFLMLEPVVGCLSKRFSLRWGLTFYIVCATALVSGA